MKLAISERAATDPESHPARQATHRRTDLRNISLLLLGFAVVVTLIPPGRSYPITDDWIYARSVGDLLNGTYRIPDWAQASSIGHIAWGALAVTIFGPGFTTLAWTNLIISAGCVLLFYGLLRELAVTPARALLGTAILGLNPIYVYLSYTFMTDITFLVFSFTASLCFIRGVRGYGAGWFWAGSGATALAYLTRQYGILLIPAALIYLWWARRWKWADVVAISAPAIVAVLGYMLWERTQPLPLVSFHTQSVLEGLAAGPVEYLLGRAMFLVWTVNALGLYLLPVVRRPRHPILGMPLFLLLVIFLALSARNYGSLFPVSGNVVDYTGYIMSGYHAQGLWTQVVWVILGILSAAILGIYAAHAGAGLRAGRRLRSSIRNRRDADPVMIVYLWGLFLALTICVAIPSLYDRYWLPIVAVLLLPGLRQAPGTTDSRDRAKPGTPWGRWALLIPLALFSLIGQRDYLAHAAARWQAAERLAARGIPRDHIDAGFEWEGWYLYDEGAAQVRSKPLVKYIPFPPQAVLDPAFAVSDVPRAGYTAIDSLPYQSWLSGGQTRYVQLLERDSSPTN